MNEATWKPLVAGLLVVCAIAMVGRNLVAPLLHRQPAVQTQEQSAIGTASVSESGFAQNPAPREPSVESTATSTLTGWTRDEDRDPFATGTIGVETRESEPPHRFARWSFSKPRPRMRINAIAVGKVKMALVDNIPVRIGDSLADGILLEILPDRLAIRNPSGDTILRFREGRTP